jgi:hypothetical protein
VCQIPLLSYLVADSGIGRVPMGSRAPLATVTDWRSWSAASGPPRTAGRPLTGPLSLPTGVRRTTAVETTARVYSEIDG